MKKVIRVVIVVFLLLGMTGSAFSQTMQVEAAATKNVKKSDYPKLIKGDLTKKQLEWVLESLVYPVSDWKADDYIDHDTIAEISYNCVNIVMKGFKQVHTNKKKINNKKVLAAYKLSDINRALSASSDFRLDNGTSHQLHCCNIITKDDIGYFVKEVLNDANKSCKIKSAKVSGNKMEIQYKGYGQDYTGKFTAEFRKSSGKFVLNKISANEVNQSNGD